MTLMIVSGFISIAGICLAYHAAPEGPRARAMNCREKFPVLARLLEAKYWVDEIYQAAIVEPLRTLGRAFFAIDRIRRRRHRLGRSASSRRPADSALKLTTQRGYLQGYAATMLFGIAVILLIVIFL